MSPCPISNSPLVSQERSAVLAMLDRLPSLVERVINDGYVKISFGKPVSTLLSCLGIATGGWL